ncbi:hypothetical protein [Paenibacillus sp. H1-7]|nr:hypothetical protein [Paenibacillus sp. H1-7]
MQARISIRPGAGIQQRPDHRTQSGFVSGQRQTGWLPDLWLVFD